MKKKITISLDTNDEIQNIIYKVLESAGRRKTQIVCEAMKQNPEVILERLASRLGEMETVQSINVAPEESKPVKKPQNEQEKAIVKASDEDTSKEEPSFDTKLLMEGLELFSSEDF